MSDSGHPPSDPDLPAKPLSLLSTGGHRGSDRVLSRLMSLHPKLIDLSLDRMVSLLAVLGNPQESLPPVVHVAGTNGKGSLLAYLRAMLEAGGRRVHHYSSPHLVRFHERIRLAGRLIDEDALLALLEEVEAANGDKPITFFEVTTIAAFLAFSRTEADILLLETGLGGRLDATNLVAEPALTAITPISVDHTQFLGNSLAEIAAEKAGIMKPGVPCVLGPQPDQALEVLEAKAAEVGAPLWIHNRHWWTETEEGGFRLFVNDGVEWLPRPGLTGQHQIDNAGLAVVCALQLGASLAPDRDARALGVASAVWPARLQQLTEGRLVETLPEGWELWLDGGHNAGAGEALAQVAKDWKDGPLHLVYGMLNNKAAEGFLRPLAKQAQGLRAVEIPGEPNSLSAEEAAQKARDSGFSAQAAPSVKAALAQIAAENPWPGRILICGSLYLAGNVLAENETFPT